MNKRVLIITYYWPPSGGAGVQRWLKFSKYLALSGWQPVIYTPENPELAITDHSLEKDIDPSVIIIKSRIWEPYEWYKKLTRKKGQQINAGFSNEGKKAGMLDKIAVWLRGNLFIPDARKFWIKPSIQFLSEYLKANPVDAVISTGPPHSMHVIAMGLKKKMDVKWIADFRDPWTNIDFYHELRLTKWADKHHHRLEKEVLTQADAVIAVGKTMAAELSVIASRKINVITNGYDDDDLQKGIINLDKKFSIAHIGTLSKTRNPIQLWLAISELIEEEKEFAHSLEIKLAGKVDIHVRESLSANNLEKYINYIEYLPHNEVAQLQQQSQVLLLILNDTPNAKGILTGKFFEYMASMRPVLCIGRKDGDAAVIITETGCGQVCEYNDKKRIKEVIMDYYRSYNKGTLISSANSVEKYSRAALTKDLVTLLNNL